LMNITFNYKISYNNYIKINMNTKAFLQLTR
jgi:hypothetical protein